MKEKTNKRTPNYFNWTNSVKRGFTLIELIVVMAVIAILVLLATPNFTGRNQEARLTQAMNDVKVLENSIEEYLLHHEKLEGVLTAADSANLQTLADANRLVETKGYVADIGTKPYFKLPQGFIKNELNVSMPNEKDAYVTEEGKVVIDIGGKTEATVPDGAGPSAPTEAKNPIPIGAGTVDSPYELWYIEHLDYIRTDIVSLGAHYKMMRSLDYNNPDHYINSGVNLPLYTTGEGWVPIGVNTKTLKTPFTGSFDGQNFKLDNLYINRAAGFNQGLFGAIHGATVKDFTIEDVNILLNGTGGALVGFLNSGSIIDNVHSSGTVTDNDGWSGGLIGYSYNATLSNLSSAVTVLGNNNMGGLIGYLEDGTISNSHASGNVTVTSEYAGGLAGYSDGATIDNCFAEGNVSGPNSIGGLIGSASSSTITNSHATGTVSGRDWVGGFAGYSDSTISNSYATGHVTASYKVAGGFVGENSYGNITDSYASGDVTATGDSGFGNGFSIGGFVGTAYSGSVSRSYALGDVSAPISALVGGFVGENDGNVNEGYAIGSVTGKSDVGGFAGKTYQYDTVSNSYASGVVTGELNFGNLIGTNLGTLTNSAAVDYSQLINGNLPAGFTAEKWKLEAGSTPKLIWE